MTRGTFYLITAKTKKENYLSYKQPIVLGSTEFNGDMYGSPLDSKDDQKIGYYNDAVKLLKKVKTENDFKKIITEFNATHHKYNENLVFAAKVAIYEHNNKPLFDFEEDNYFRDYSSDYLYWKNISGDSVFFKEQDKSDSIIELPTSKIATFRFGNFIEII